MRDFKPAGNMLWAVLLLFAATVGFNGCSDVSNVSAPPGLSPDALLSTLTVIPGTLQPVFSSDVANYTVDVLNTVTSVTVTATPQDAKASMKINGQATTPGQARTITLGVPGSSTPIPIVVTAQSGSQNTYIVTVTRAALASDNSLKSLTVAPGLLAPAFNPSTTSYTVDVASDVAGVTVTAQAQDASATVSINGGPATNSSSQSVSLGVPGTNTNISIVVEAANGNLRTYLMTVNRAALGGNNLLQNLTVSSGSLSPTFNPSTTTYSVDVATGLGSASVTATLQDLNASMTVNGQGTTSGQAKTIQLGNAGLSTLISIVVTAPNGTPNTYSLFVNRAAPASDNNLSALSVVGHTLSPPFTANTLIYTVDVLTNVTSVTVSATKSDPNAVMSGSVTAGAGQPAGQATIQLGGAPSSTTVSIIVTAPSTSQKTYTVTVHRAAPASDNNLSALSVSGQTLVPPFAPGTQNYTVDVLTDVTSVTVSATKSDPNAVMSGSVTAGVGQPAGQATIQLGGAPSITTVSIIMTAPSTSQKTYTVTVHRAAPANSNNNLSTLAVSAGTLSPPFIAGTPSYNVTVLNATLTTTVTATVADSTATLTINGAAAISGIAAGPIALSVGANPIPIVVTAQDGTPKTYTVTVNRQTASGNNNLLALNVSAGALIETFDPGTLNYTVTASNTTTDTTITARVADSTATLTINGSPATSEVASGIILLVPGQNPAIPIVVTAQDGTPQSYTVTITVN